MTTKDRREIEANKKQLKRKVESFYKKDKKRMVRDSKYAKDAMLNNPWKEDVDPKKFPGFDQAGRIRGGLKKGGRAKHNIGGRANLLEEMGRLDAERMNPNRRAEKHRVIGELNKGYKSGGKVLKGKKVGCQIK